MEATLKSAAWVVWGVMLAGASALGAVKAEAGSPPQAGPTTRPASVSAYYIGHSLNAGIPDMVAAFCAATQGGSGDAAGGVAFTFKEQFILGSPLRWQWQERERDAAQRTWAEPVYRATWFEALPTGKFDTLVMIDSVPRGPAEMGETREYAGKFIAEAVKGNPHTRVFIYEPWHCLKTGTPEGCAYDKSSPTRDLKWPQRVAADAAMWDTLVAELRADHPGVEIQLIPAARGLAKLEEAILRGELAGMKSLADCFGDEIHPNPYGNYFIASLHYAMLTGRSPVGLPVEVKDRWGRSYWDTPNWENKSWPPPDARAVKRMQEIAWEMAGGE